MLRHLSFTIAFTFLLLSCSKNENEPASTNLSDQEISTEMSKRKWQVTKVLVGSEGTWHDHTSSMPAHDLDDYHQFLSDSTYLQHDNALKRPDVTSDTILLAKWYVHNKTIHLVSDNPNQSYVPGAIESFTPSTMTVLYADSATGTTKLQYKSY